jgi:NADH-quinone oxidoreductase E subunit
MGDQVKKPLHPAAASSQPFQVTDLRPTEKLFDDPEGRDRLDKALSRYPEKRAALLPMLGYAQERNGWVSDENMAEIAGELDLTPAYVRSVATFYTMYNKHPVGRHLIQVCTCISCHLAEAEEVFQRFLSETGTRAGEVSEDGKFTVIEAECLGACGFATAVQINDRYFENVTPEKVSAILDELD